MFPPGYAPAQPPARRFWLRSLDSLPCSRETIGNYRDNQAWRRKVKDVQDDVQDKNAPAHSASDTGGQDDMDAMDDDIYGGLEADIENLPSAGIQDSDVVDTAAVVTTKVQEPIVQALNQIDSSIIRTHRSDMDFAAECANLALKHWLDADGGEVHMQM